MSDLKEGVYLKNSGKLALVIKEEAEEDSYFKYKWSVIDGRKSTNKLLVLLTKPADRPYMAWECFSNEENYDAWGPTAFLNNCEYLGEL